LRNSKVKKENVLYNKAVKHIIVLVLCFALLFGSVLLYFSTTYPTSSPFKSVLYFIESLIEPRLYYKNYVIGFLPYWRLSDDQFVKPKALSEINYFSLTVGPDGHIAKSSNGQSDPGWYDWNLQSTKDFITRAQIMGANVSVTFAAQDNQLIKTILSSNTAQEQLITDILDQVKSRKINGANIDFEYTGEPDTLYKHAFTSFSKNLATQIKKQNQNAVLTLSIMPLSARQKDLYDFPKLIPLYDRFIGMSYDYYNQASDVAGPIEPMHGFKQGNYFFDVTTTYADYLTYLPKNKLIMGIPTYGWEWAVQNGQTIKSRTLPLDDPNSYAAVISYARSRKDSDLKPSQCQWDNLSEETWCWFKDKKTGVYHQAWIVDNRMLQARFDYADQQKLGGVALWTLGLDKNYPDIWERLTTTFSQ